MAPSEKSALRARTRGLVRAMTREERLISSRVLCESARPQRTWREARVVLFYSALEDEPNLMLLLAEAWNTGKSAALPRFDPASGHYEAAHLRGEEDLCLGRFGIQEPGPGCPLIPLNQLDLVFVPGVAFDFTGRRLGRGKGFYDRLLAEVRGHKCGVAFDQQIVAAVPEEPHDMRVNSILTPTQWRLCQSAA